MEIPKKMREWNFDVDLLHEYLSSFIARVYVYSDKMEKIYLRSVIHNGVEQNHQTKY